MVDKGKGCAHYLSLSPTKSTSSVEAYRMTNSDNLWSSDSANTSSSDNGPAAGPSGSHNAELEEQGTWIEGNCELLSLIRVLQGAADPKRGASMYECFNLLEKCSHCCFTPEAYRLHIRTVF